MKILPKDRILFVTKHRKELLLNDLFDQHFGAEIVVSSEIDTDQFGTFSGEIPRKGSQITAAKSKILAAEKLIDADYYLASEGSFAPDPVLPLLTNNRELLVMKPKNQDVWLVEEIQSFQTNFRTETVEKWQELERFAKAIGFPEHAMTLIFSTKKWLLKKKRIISGVQNWDELRALFDGKKPQENLLVMTDMRAMSNPSRQKQIRILAEKMIERLKSNCPKCAAGGFGRTDVQFGLPCLNCQLKTDLVDREIWTCVFCGYQESKTRADGLESADPANCQYCNP